MSYGDTIALLSSIEVRQSVLMGHVLFIADVGHVLANVPVRDVPLIPQTPDPNVFNYRFTKKGLMFPKGGVTSMPIVILPQGYVSALEHRVYTVFDPGEEVCFYRSVSAASSVRNHFIGPLLLDALKSILLLTGGSPSAYLTVRK
jgi:hypothetical protein